MGVFVVACSQDYFYERRSNPTARVNGITAAAYQIPPELPQGDVRIATLGIARFGTDRRWAHHSCAHVRMVVANNAGEPWMVDGREQRAVLAK